jgi:hypothetical protein
MTYDGLISYCTRNGRVCPQPNQWKAVWEMLPNRRRKGGGWEPSLPLILGSWWDTTDAQKKSRLRQHVRWANEHGVLAELSEFILSLQEDQWHHEGE